MSDDKKPRGYLSQMQIKSINGRLISIDFSCIKKTELKRLQKTLGIYLKYWRIKL